MQGKFHQIIAAIHQKRCLARPLTKAEFMLLLADCIVDKRLFTSPRWNWRYGGVRYVPTETLDIDPSKILVLQWPGVLGDVAMSAPAISVLRQKYPQSEISLLSSKAAQSIFLGNPAVNLFINNPLDAHIENNMGDRPVDLDALIEDIATLVSVLSESAYDLVINLQVLPMSATLAKLSGARHTVGMGLTSDGMPVIHGNFWSAYLFGVSADLMRRYNPLHRTEIFSLMIDEKKEFSPDPTIFISPNATERVQTFLCQNGIGDKDLVVGISPMAGTPIRMWRYYAELARRIRDQLKAKVIMLGYRDEETALEQIVENAGEGIIKATHFDLQELMAAICGCDLFITNDTGPMHLACLIRKKVLALFGPTSFGEVGPWGTEFHILQSSRCRACYRQVCRDNREYCMDQIRVEDAYGLVEGILRNRPADEVGTHLIYASSNDPHPHHGKEERLGRLLLHVLREKGSREEGNDRRSEGLFGLGHKLFRECDELMSRTKQAINCLESPSPARIQRLDSINQSIYKANSILRPIVFFNDLKFIDKRFSFKETPLAHREFYGSILSDIHRILRL